MSSDRATVGHGRVPINPDLNVSESVCGSLGAAAQAGFQRLEAQHMMDITDRIERVSSQRQTKDVIEEKVYRRVVVSSAGRFPSSANRAHIDVDLTAGKAPGKLVGIRVTEASVPLDGTIYMPPFELTSFVMAYVTWELVNGANAAPGASLVVPIPTPPQYGGFDHHAMAEHFNHAIMNWDGFAPIPIGQPYPGNTLRKESDFVSLVNQLGNFWMEFDEASYSFRWRRADPAAVTYAPASPNYIVNSVSVSGASAEWCRYLGLSPAAVYPAAELVLDRMYDVPMVALVPERRITGLQSQQAQAIIPRAILIQTTIVDAGYSNTAGTTNVIKAIPVDSRLKPSENVTWNAGSAGAEANPLMTAQYFDPVCSFRLLTLDGIEWTTLTDWWVELQLEFV